MGRLDKPRHEKFCQLIARGSGIFKAYQDCDYEGGAANASDLRHKQNIHARIEELRDEIGFKATLDRDYVLAKLQINAEKALEQEFGSNVANRALELIGKDAGMFEDTVKHLHRIEQSSDAELLADLDQAREALEANEAKLLQTANIEDAEFEEVEGG